MRRRASDVEDPSAGLILSRDAARSSRASSCPTSRPRGPREEGLRDECADEFLGEDED
jgi:hypothetical protein